MKRLHIVIIVIVALSVVAAYFGKLSLPGLAGVEHGRPHRPGETAHGGVDAQEPVSVTVFTPKLLLFMEYPPLVKGEPADFLAHFTVLETGEPIRSGVLRFVVTGPDGLEQSITIDAPRRAGLFVPRPSFDQAGEYELRLAVESPQVAEVVPVGVLRVHANAAEAAAEAESEHDPDNAVPFLLEQQWKIGLRLARAEQRHLVERLDAPGLIEIPDTAAAVVSAPVAGLLHPPPGGLLPRLGETVTEGQVLAMIEPQLPSVAETATYMVDIELKGLEIERELSEARAAYRFAQTEWERVSGLHQQGVAGNQELEQRRRDIDVAQAQLDAAQAMKKRYDLIYRRLARVQQAIERKSVSSDDAHYLLLPVHAPISGQITQAAQRRGEHVDAHATLFRIVNAERVWVTAHVSEFDLGTLSEPLDAVVVPEGLPHLARDISAGDGVVVFLSPEVAPESRTISMVFEMDNPDLMLRGGMFATVRLATRRALDAVAIPEEAVLREAGRPIAFVMIEGETFQKRDLEIGVRDGGFVEVKSGVSAGEYVATKGAYVLKLAAAAPAFAGHGHVH
jgi:cobalt-zinc-cadmium efflux system membrane fusion protein